MQKISGHIRSHLRYPGVGIRQPCVSVCVRACAFVCVSVSLSVCACAFVCVSVSLSLCVCAFVYVHVYVCMCVCDESHGSFVGEGERVVGQAWAHRMSAKVG